MRKEKNKDDKRCFFCHKRLVNNKAVVCRRCQLQGKDIGEKVLGVGVALGTTALLVAQALGSMNNDNSNDD